MKELYRMIWPKKKITTKNIWMWEFAFIEGAIPSPFMSIAEPIIVAHPPTVEIIKAYLAPLKGCSMLKVYFTQSPPQFKQSSLVWIEANWNALSQ